MADDIEILKTGDGSHTLYNKALNETYHSKHGALQESIHVYIQMGLDTFPSEQPLHIFEFGLGTGLNLMLTIEAFLKNPERPIVYHTIESFPLAASITGHLNYDELFDSDEVKSYFTKIHAAPWNEEIQLLNGFSLKKIHSTFETYEPLAAYYDLIYFDAFAPSKQPEVWDESIFHKLYHILKNKGKLVTYCSQGQFKRNLKASGFQVETLPGPPYKKEMVRAFKV